MSGALISRARRNPGVIAAFVHRLSGIALAIFLPLHFIALGLALSGAPALEGFLTLTRNPLMRTLEAGLVGALAVHFACGLRVLALEMLDFRERTAVSVAFCFAVGLFVGLLYLLSVA